jgi:hypothetical protein
MSSPDGRLGLLLGRLVDWTQYRRSLVHNYSEIIIVNSAVRTLRVMHVIQEVGTSKPSPGPTIESLVHNYSKIIVVTLLVRTLGVIPVVWEVGSRARTQPP